MFFSLMYVWYNTLPTRHIYLYIYIYETINGKSMETETWSEFSNGGKAIVEQILASEERNISKTTGLLESQSGIWVGKLTTWVRSFEITPEYVSQSLWWTLKSPQTKILVDGLIERTSSMLGKTESKTVHKDKEVDQ